MKRPNCISALFALLAIGVTATSVQASTLYTLDPSTTTTRTSGSMYLTNTTMGSTGDFKAINRITNWESGDHPCHIKVKMRHLNNYNETSAAHNLKSGNCSGDKITVGYSDTETYIRGIQVCTKWSRIKGLRVWGSKLNRHNGALTNVARVEDKRPNCDRWHVKYYCPAGKVATQIIADHNSPDYSGIALKCREIVVK